MPPTVFTTAEWMNMAKMYLESIGADVGYLDTSDKCDTEKMNLMSSEEMDVDPRECLQYYASWMAYYKVQVYGWSVMHDWLERKYKNLTEQSWIEDDEKMAAIKQQAKARVRLSNLSDASLYAKAQLLKSKTNLEMAEVYRDVVSRSITARESERRLMGR